MDHNPRPSRELTLFNFGDDFLSLHNNSSDPTADNPSGGRRRPPLKEIDFFSRWADKSSDSNHDGNGSLPSTTDRPLNVRFHLITLSLILSSTSIQFGLFISSCFPSFGQTRLNQTRVSFGTSVAEANEHLITEVLSECYASKNICLFVLLLLFLF